jgi:hypothetical protein
MLRRDDCQIVAEVLKDRNAFIFRVKPSTKSSRIGRH